MKLKNILKRFASPVVITCIATQIIAVSIVLTPEISDKIKVVVFAVVEILNVAGLLNNPTTKDF